MTRAELHQMVLLNFGQRTDKTDLINRALDMALLRVLTVNQWSFSNKEADLTINLNDSNVALPSDCGKVMTATLVDGSSNLPLIGKTIDAFNSVAIVNEFTIVSVPTIICQEGLNLKFFPPADKSYEIHISYMLKTSFSNDSSESPDKSLDEAIISYATYYCCLTIEPNLAQMWFNNYQNSLYTALIADRRQGKTITTTPTYRRCESVDYDEDSIRLVHPLDLNELR